MGKRKSSVRGKETDAHSEGVGVKTVNKPSRKGAFGSGVSIEGNGIEDKHGNDQIESLAVSFERNVMEEERIQKLDFLIEALHELKAKYYAQTRGLDPETEKKIGDLLEENYRFVRELEFVQGQLKVYEEIYKSEGAQFSEEVGAADEVETVCVSVEDIELDASSSKKLKKSSTVNKNRKARKLVNS